MDLRFYSQLMATSRDLLEHNMGVETSYHTMLWSSHVFQEKTIVLKMVFSWCSPGQRSFSAAAQSAHLTKAPLPYISVAIFLPVAEEPDVERRIHILDFLCKTSTGNLNKSFQVETASPHLQ